MRKAIHKNWTEQVNNVFDNATKCTCVEFSRQQGTNIRIDVTTDNLKRQYLSNPGWILYQLYDNSYRISTYCNNRWFEIN